MLHHAFHQRIQSHPDELLQIFHKLSTTYEDAKTLRRVDARLASLRFDELLQKVHFLQRLPAESVPIEYGTWSYHLSRIYNLCQEERDQLRRARITHATFTRTGAPTDAAMAATLLHEQPPLAQTRDTQYHHTKPKQARIAPSSNSSHTLYRPDHPSHLAVTGNDTDATLVPWIRDWNEPTLQSEVVRRLVRRMVVPMMFPDVIDSSPSLNPSLNRARVDSRIVLVDGPANTGKSYALSSIHRYLQSHHQPVRWVEWTAYDCPKRAQALLDAGDTSEMSGLVENEWTVYVTDRVTEEDIQRWAKEPWLSAWDKRLCRVPRTLWVVVATVTASVASGASGASGVGSTRGCSRAVSKEPYEHESLTDTSSDTATSNDPFTSHPTLARLFVDRYTFAYPDSATLFHYFKYLIANQYSVTLPNGQRGFPPFVRLPIVHELSSLSVFVDTLCRRQPPPDFRTVDRVFRLAVDHCTRLGLAENVLYGVVDGETVTSALDKVESQVGGGEGGDGEEGGEADGDGEANGEDGGGSDESPENNSSDQQESPQEAAPSVFSPAPAPPAPTHHWYPKHSIDLATLPDYYDYRLIAPLRHDTFEWCPQLESTSQQTPGTRCAVNPVTFWNVQLLDSLPSTETDRLVHLYIDPASVGGSVEEVVGDEVDDTVADEPAAHPPTLPQETPATTANTSETSPATTIKTSETSETSETSAPSGSSWWSSWFQRGGGASNEPGTTESDVYSVIANFPITTHIFPYHLDNGFDRCYEWTLSLWMATTRALRTTQHLSQGGRPSDAEERWETLRSMGDVCESPEAVWKAWLEADLSDLSERSDLSEHSTTTTSSGMQQQQLGGGRRLRKRKARKARTTQHSRRRRGGMDEDQEGRMENGIESGMEGMSLMNRDTNEDTDIEDNTADSVDSADSANPSGFNEPSDDDDRIELPSSSSEEADPLSSSYRAPPRPRPRAPLTPAQQLLSTFTDVRTTRMILYIEQYPSPEPSPEPSETTSSSSSSARVHLTCGGRSTAELDEYREGIPGDLRAKEMSEVLRVLCASSSSSASSSSLRETLTCDVVQVQTHSGYAYHIDFNRSPSSALHARAANDDTIVTVMPRVGLLPPRTGMDLDEGYRLTTEADVDALTEAFPRVYKDMFREEESTWKLQPVRHPSHLDVLNQKYSNEVKCYLKLFCDLMRAKERHYGVLRKAIRTMLDDALIDLQNHLDYLLQILPEQDHDGKWNEVWSMSPHHPQYERYHPPAHDEVDKVIPLDLATEWLRNGSTFAVSPRLLEAVYALTAAFVETEAHRPATDSRNSPQSLASPQTSAPITDLFRTWQRFVRGDILEQTEWVYVKSQVKASEWKAAVSVGKVLEQAFPTGGHNGSRGIASSSEHTPLRCLSHPTWMRHYTARTSKHSLFHTLFRNAEHIGYHDPTTQHIQWHTFSNASADDPLDAMLHELHHEPTLWSLLSRSCSQSLDVCHPWLFALCQAGHTTTEGSLLSYRDLYSHLLFFRDLHYWTLYPNNVLDDIQRQTTLDHFVRQYAYVHRSVYHQPLELGGAHPGKYVRRAIHPTPFVSLAPHTSKDSKKVMEDEEMKLVRVYGLGVHHLEDVAGVEGL